MMVLVASQAAAQQGFIGVGGEISMVAELEKRNLLQRFSPLKSFDTNKSLSAGLYFCFKTFIRLDLAQLSHTCILYL